MSPLLLLWSIIAGMGLGLFYFGGLWLTVRQLPTARNPALLAFGSFLGRTAATVAGFYLVMAGDWRRLLACLGGFLFVRTILVMCWKPESSVNPPTDRKESRP